MPLYKNECFRNGQSKVFNVSHNQISAILANSNDLRNEYYIYANEVNPYNLSNLEFDLVYPVKSTLINSYYYVYEDENECYHLFINGNHIEESSLKTEVGMMLWIAKQSWHLSPELEELINTLQCDTDTGGTTILYLVYYHLRHLEEVLNA